MDIQSRLEQLYSSGKLGGQTLDEKAVSCLEMLEPSVASRCVSVFEGKDLSDVRNMSALFMSTVKAVKEQMTGLTPAPRFGGSYGPSYGYPGQGIALGSVLQPGMGLNMGMGMAPVGVYGLAGMVGAGRQRDYAMAQAASGVRINELHNLSHYARYVPPEPALRLQLLWDSGNRLVSLLDETAWKAMSELEAGQSLQVINEVSEAMKVQEIRNVNAYFMSVAKKYLTGPAGVAPGPLGQPGHGMPQAVAYAMHSACGAGMPAYGAGAAAYGAGAAAYGAGATAYADGSGRYAGAPGMGGGGAGRGVPSVHLLPPAVQQKAMELISHHGGRLKDTHFDEPLCTQLNRLPEQKQLEVLGELGMNDLAMVHNVPGYLTGIVKRFLAGGTR